MKKSSFLITFTLFLALFSFSGYAAPAWSGNVASTPTNYSPSIFSQFNITWANDVNMTFIAITSSTGYVLVNNASMSNLTYGGDIYNFSAVLPAGTFNWTSYANDSANNWNSSDTWSFTINKANLSFSIIGSNVIYPSSINIITSESNSGDSDINYTLYRNNSGLVNFSAANGTAPAGMIELLPVGAYLYTFNTSVGPFQNYTANATGLNATVTVGKGTPSVALYINGNIYNKIVNLNETVNLTAVSNVTGLNVSLNLNWTGYLDNFQNGTSPQTNLTDTGLLGLGIFNFSAKVIGNNNYIDSSLGTLYFYVANFSVSPSSVNYVQNAPYNFSIILPVNSSNVVFEADFNGTYVNYTNSTNVTNWNKIITMYNNTNGGYWINFTDLQATTYNYRWIVNDTNFSTDQKTYTVNQFPITPSFAVSGSSTWVTTTSTSVTLICTASPYQANLTISGSGCPGTLDDYYATCTFTTPSTQGSSIYTCLASGNYIGQNQQTLSYAPFTSNQGSGGSGSSNQTPSGSFTILASSSSVTMEPNTSRDLTITLKNTFTGDITLINLTVTGINSTWYSLDKTSIAKLLRNGGNDTVKLTMNIPSDAERKIYTITVTAAGRDFNLNKLTRITAITLTIPQAHAPQNVTQNVTQNATQGSNATTTTGSGVTGAGAPTGLTINPEDLENVVLFIGFLASALIFIFRNNVTNLLMSSYKPSGTKKEETKKEESKAEKKEEKKKSILSKLRNMRLVIQYKEKEKT